jgi:hypothetical protein
MAKEELLAIRPSGGLLGYELMADICTTDNVFVLLFLR